MVPEVDCVLSAAEVLELAREVGLLPVLGEGALVQTTAPAPAAAGSGSSESRSGTSPPERSKPSRSSGGSALLDAMRAGSDPGVTCSSAWQQVSSGAYAEHALRFAALALAVGLGLSGLEDAARQLEGPLSWRKGRNADMWEAALVVPGSARKPEKEGGSDSSSAGLVLRAATAYGFRNIQGIISRLRKQSRQMKRKEGSGLAPAPPVLDLVETMACPSGCANGGGQPKLARSSEAVKAGEVSKAEAQAARAELVQQAMRSCSGCGVEACSCASGAARGDRGSKPADSRAAGRVADAVRSPVSCLREMQLSPAACAVLEAVGSLPGGLDGSPLGTQFHRVPPMVSEVAGSAVRW